MTSLEKGIRVLYADLIEKATSKRFIVPHTEEMETKLKALHASSVYPITVDVMGEAIIQETLQDGDFESLSWIPSLVLSHYQVQLIDHPVLQTGVARYSEALITFLKELEIEETPVAEEKFPVANSLVDQLRSQVLDKETTPVIEETPVVKGLAEQLRSQISSDVPAPKEEMVVLPPEPTAPDGQLSLDELIYQKRQQKQNRTALVPTSPNLIRMVQEIHAAVCPETSIQGVSAKELSSWFIRYSTEHGMDKTFEYLASKIPYWE